MSRHLLSNTSDWELSNSEQDVRGADVLGPGGVRVGTVRDMVVDTDVERVTGLVLEDGTEIPAADVRISGGQVFLGADAAGPEPTVAVFDDAGHVRRVESVDRTDTPPSR